MRFGSVRWTACAAIAVLCAPLPLAAADVDVEELRFDRDQEVTIDAAEISYDRKEDSVSAVGEVEIRHGDTVLRADRVKVNRSTQDAEALGNATLDNPAISIQADEMRINLLDETGTLVDVEMQSDTFGYTLRGERIEKREGQKYRIENGNFTSCQCEDPDETVPWSVSGKLFDIDLDGYGDVHGGRLLIADIPVLYIPRAAFPVSQKRHSGFLFPRVGLSNRRGFQILQPYYWAIDKSQDLTVSVDIETAQRFGLIGEHRYALSRRSGGEMQAMYFNESIRGRPTEVTVPGLRNVDVPENRWGVIGNHSLATERSEIYTDIFLVGDDLFLREINTFTLDDAREVAIRTRPFTTSRLGAIHRWDRAIGKVEGVYSQNLVGPESNVIQVAPQGSLAAQKQLGYGLLTSVDTSVTNFERTTGITGVRADIFPRIDLRLPLGRSLSGSIGAGVRETAYALTQDRTVGGLNGQATGAEADTLINLPSTSHREIFEVRGDLRTGFSRVFDFQHFGLSRLKHTIEPQLGYLYIPAVNQDELPLFDGDDRIAERNVVSYGFSSRMLAKRARTSDTDSDDAADTVFELARLSLVQSFDFTGSVPQQGAPNQRTDLSDLDFTMRVNPAAGTSVRFASTLDPDDAELTSATVAVLLREPGWILPDTSWLSVLQRSSFAIEYRFIADNSVPGSSAVEQLDSSVLLQVTEQIGLRYAGRFTLADSRALGNYFGMSYLSSCDCWSVDMGISDRANPNEVQFQMQLNLLGFGSAEGGSPTGFSSVY